ncbi:Chitin synthase, class 2, partial [Kappamyces sp. JEL0680]
VKQALEVMGLFDESIALPERNGTPVAAHVFERTTNVFINSVLEVEYKETPMQCIFVLKQENAKKINSHRWFFNAICAKLNPDVCMLLDIGTKPTPSSFFDLYRAFDDPHVGGACGEIFVELGSMWENLANPLVAAQNFEYKMSNILDKPFESYFGYISVLPGAFSAYRWNAIQGAPLAAYFHGEHPTTNIRSANLYLAEDRILCWEVVAKENASWVLRYVKNAKAETDCPDNLTELISQRRRWLNGSFFAAVHSLICFPAIFRAGHSRRQKYWFSLQAFYNVVNLLLVWFAVGNFYITFYSLFDTRRGTGSSSGSPDPFQPYGEAVLYLLQVCYFFGVLAVLVSSLGNRPKGSKILYA